MDPLVWSAVLLVLGLLLVVGEVFVPSAGMLGFLAIASIIASVGLAFYSRGLEVGVIFLSVAAIALPLTMALAFRWWPHTAMGKRLLPSVPRADELLLDSPQRRHLRGLVGKVGTASSKMLPSGAVNIDGVTLDAVSEGMAIEPGTRVEVVDVRGNRVLVRPAVDNPRQEKVDDILSQPIDELGLDPFGDPLA